MKSVLDGGLCIFIWSKIYPLTASGLTSQRRSSIIFLPIHMIPSTPTLLSTSATVLGRQSVRVAALMFTASTLINDPMMTKHVNGLCTLKISRIVHEHATSFHWFHVKNVSEYLAHTPHSIPTRIIPQIRPPRSTKPYDRSGHRFLCSKLPKAHDYKVNR